MLQQARPLRAIHTLAATVSYDAAREPDSVGGGIQGNILCPPAWPMTAWRPQPSVRGLGGRQPHRAPSVRRQMGIADSRK